MYGVKHIGTLQEFLHKLAHNNLPTYFDLYRPYLQETITPYKLRSNVLHAPPITHVYAESTLLYQSVQMLNNTMINDNDKLILINNDKLILDKLVEKSH